MPTYEYHCDSCDKNFDVVQSFHDDPLTACPTCGAPVRKVFGNVGIVFKGSGFYKTDSRNGSSAKADADGETHPLRHRIPARRASESAEDESPSKPTRVGASSTLGDLAGQVPTRHRTRPEEDASTPAKTADELVGDHRGRHVDQTDELPTEYY